MYLSLFKMILSHANIQIYRCISKKNPITFPFFKGKESVFFLFFCFLLIYEINKSFHCPNVIILQKAFIYKNVSNVFPFLTLNFYYNVHLMPFWDSIIQGGEKIISRHQHRYPWPFLTTILYCPLLPAGLQGYILYRHRAAVCSN